jgi:hypothetical protein
MADELSAPFRNFSFQKLFFITFQKDFPVPFINIFKMYPVHVCRLDWFRGSDCDVANPAAVSAITLK